MKVYNQIKILEIQRLKTEIHTCLCHINISGNYTLSCLVLVVHHPQIRIFRCLLACWAQGAMMIAGIYDYCYLMVRAGL